MKGFFYRYIKLYRPLITALNKLLGEYELSYSLWQVIFYVHHSGPCTLVEISKYYEVEKPSITRMVQKLEERGIVEQIPGKDRREKVIRTTAAGEEVYQICRKKITALEYEVMKGIPEAEQQAVFAALPKIRENILNQGEKAH